MSKFLPFSNFLSNDTTFHLVNFYKTRFYTYFFRCEELRHCVECQAYKTGTYDESECNIKCHAFVTNVVEKIDEENIDEDVKICRTPDNSGCTILFQYTYDENKELIVKAQKYKICSEIVNVFGKYASMGL